MIHNKLHYQLHHHNSISTRLSRRRPYGHEHIYISYNIYMSACQHVSPPISKSEASNCSYGHNYLGSYYIRGSAGNPGGENPPETVLNHSNEIRASFVLIEIRATNRNDVIVLL